MFLAFRLGACGARWAPPLHAASQGAVALPCGLWVGPAPQLAAAARTSRSGALHHGAGLAVGPLAFGAPVSLLVNVLRGLDNLEDHFQFQIHDQ